MVCLKDCTVFYQITWKKCLIHAPLWERKDNKLLGKMFSEKVFAKRDLYIPHVHTWQPLAILHLPVSNCHNFCYMYERISSYEPLILFGFRFWQIAHYLTFEWFYGWFREEKVYDKIPGKNNILHTEKNIRHQWRKMLKKKSYTAICGGKKCLTPEVWEKIITSKSPIPPSPTNVQWSCQPFWGWGLKRIW